METRLRIELINARLPHPSVQAELPDASGSFIGRADLYYAGVRVFGQWAWDSRDIAVAMNRYV